MMTTKTDRARAVPAEDINIGETIALCISLGMLALVCVSIIFALGP